VLFLIGLGGLVSKVLSGSWIILWLVVLVGTLIPLAGHPDDAIDRSDVVLAQG
jgi:hypothetical protein